MGRLTVPGIAGVLALLLLCSSMGAAQPTGKGSVRERREGSPARRDDAPLFDVLHYRVDLTLAMSDADLRGVVSIVMLLRAPASRVTLNEARLQLDTVLVNGSLTTFMVDSAAEAFTVNLGSTANAGDTLSLTIAYRRDPQVSRPSLRQGYYFFPGSIGLPANLGYTMSEPSDARFWMPCFDQPWDKATAELHITVPAGYVAASNGKLDSVTAAPGGMVTWHWREDHQIATYLMCATVSQFSVSTIPFERSPHDTVPVQYYVWAPDSQQTASYLPTVRDMIAAYSALYGPYPFDKYGMTGIVPFGFGGMEHQSITTLNRYVETNEDVVNHELAHQWWGDLVTCGAWPDIWLNESFATYSEALWHEYREGKTQLKSFMRDALTHFDRGSWQGAVYDPVGQGFNLFDDVVYSKGAWVLHMLRGIVGDSTFFRVLREYRRRFSGRSALTADFQAVVDSVAGMDFGGFFREWIYGSGWPKYDFRYAWQDDLLTCTITQRQPSSWPTFTMPITVTAHLQVGGTATFVIRDSLRTQSFSMPLAFVPDSVVLDPDGWILWQNASSPGPPGRVTLSFRVRENYPNPFNSRTRIQYSLPERSNVTITVYDILGRKVATLVHENKPAGEYVVDFDGSNLASGIYILRVQAGGQSTEKKMALVR